MLLDLDEIDRVFSLSRLYSASRPAISRFRRSDYLCGAHAPLHEAVRDRVEHHLARRPRGPIRLLTHLRYLGYCFNPVSVYYCFDEDARTIDAVLCEITNTPWKERHAYVLDWKSGDPAGASVRFAFDKAFHISPFMAMDQHYDWRFTPPGRRLAVHMDVRDDGEPVFDATLALRRREITPRALRRVLWRYPAMTAAVITRIHLEALRLWLKRVPVHPHPRRLGRPNPTTHTDTLHAENPA